MTKEALRKIREDRGLTREQLAQQLGGCKAGAIVQWEGGTRTIPFWVEEKLLRSVDVTLPITELKELVDYAVQTSQPFEALVASAIREYLAHRRTHLAIHHTRQAQASDSTFNECDAAQPFTAFELDLIAQAQAMVQAQAQAQSHAGDNPADSPRTTGAQPHTQWTGPQ